METCPRDELIAKLKALKACQPALDWLASLPPETTLQEAWTKCEVGDWLAWIHERAAKISGFGDCSAFHLNAYAVRKSCQCPERVPEPSEVAICPECHDRLCACGRCHDCESDIDLDDDEDDDCDLGLCDCCDDDLDDDEDEDDFDDEDEDDLDDEELDEEDEDEGDLEI